MITLRLGCSKHPRYSPAGADGQAKSGEKVTCPECRDLLDTYEVVMLHLQKYPPPKARK